MSLRHPTPEQWYNRIWLPACSFVYLGICLFDFIGMPIYTAMSNSKLQDIVIERVVKSQDFVTYSQSIVNANMANRQWDPLTLRGGGLFHLAFGAILGGGAVTRGFAKKSEIEGYYRKSEVEYKNNETKE